MARASCATSSVGVRARGLVIEGNIMNTTPRTLLWSGRSSILMGIAFAPGLTWPSPLIPSLR